MFDRELRRAVAALPSPEGGCIDSERLVTFYTGAIAEAEAEPLREHLAACARCVAAAAEARRFVEAIDGPSARQVPRIAARWRLGWAAAAALVVLAVLFLYRAAAPAPPGEASRWDALAIAKAPYPLPDPDESLLWRSGSGNVAGRFAEGMAAYEAGDFEPAARLLAKAVEESPRDDRARFYLGVTLLLLRRPAEALEPLERAAAASAAGVRLEARWYLALASLQSDRTERARAILQGVAADRQGSRAQEARALLARIGEPSPAPATP